MTERAVMIDCSSFLLSKYNKARITQICVKSSKIKMVYTRINLRRKEGSKKHW